MRTFSTSKVPPIKVGDKTVTYCPSGTWSGIRGDSKLVFRCQIQALHVDGKPVSRISGTPPRGCDVRADLVAPDDTSFLDVPYAHSVGDNGGSSWVRPYILSATLRYR